MSQLFEWDKKLQFCPVDITSVSVQCMPNAVQCLLVLSCCGQQDRTSCPVFGVHWTGQFCPTQKMGEGLTLDLSSMQNIPKCPHHWKWPYKSCLVLYNKWSLKAQRYCFWLLHNWVNTEQTNQQVKKIFDFLKNGFQDISNSLDLSFQDESVADEKIPFLAYLAGILKDSSRFPYEPPTGSKRFRDLIAGFMKTYHHVPITADVRSLPSLFKKE